jgi:hypothetical protein
VDDRANVVSLVDDGVVPLVRQAGNIQFPNKRGHTVRDPRQSGNQILKINQKFTKHFDLPFV